ncbi:MAG: hypothetical protein C4563_04595 [Desulfobulbus sp.]|jgi:hypothetical protein|nr:MAG: hypothetical protein C4563_04595 [Desulfobulbus sp.]
MKRIVPALALCATLAAGPALAHHPAADIVDPEIYAMIDAMVADTPHADMVFDDVMGTTTITADSVSAAEDLIDDGLLAVLSLLEDDVTVTITFGEEMLAESSEAAMTAGDSWTERNDWGRPVIFTVDTLLRVEE